MSINIFLQPVNPQIVNIVLLAEETQNSEMHKSQMSIYSAKLKGLLNKQLHKDKMNGIGGLYMQLRYSWLNSFLRKTSIE